MRDRGCCARTRFTDANMLFRIKYFAHPLLEEFSRENLQPNFRKVHLVKPPASRSDSRETYFLCMGFKGGDEPTPVTGSEFGLLPE